MTIKLKYNKERFILFAILALCIFSCLILPGMITMLLSVLAMGYMAVAEKNALVKKNKITNSLFLVIPVFFSAFQNVYLAIGVNHQSSLSLQIMLSLHILLIMMMIILNSKLVFSKIPNVLLLLLVLLAYGLVMYVAYPAPITSLISASRNIISCMFSRGRITVLESILIKKVKNSFWKKTQGLRLGGMHIMVLNMIDLEIMEIIIKMPAFKMC